MNYLEICGLIFHGSLLICALVVIFATSKALRDENEHIYKDEHNDRSEAAKINYEDDAVESEIDTRFLNHLDKLGQ